MGAWIWLSDGWGGFGVPPGRGIVEGIVGLYDIRTGGAAHIGGVG